MTAHVKLNGIQVAENLHQFLKQDVLPGTGLDETTFFRDWANLIADFEPRREALMKERDGFQSAIDEWHSHRADIGRDFNQEHYNAFRKSIGYKVPEGPDFKIGTQNLDPEIATLAGSQLVAPVANARFATNAANARWVSLYGALYESNIVPETGDLKRGQGYNEARGAEVIKFTEDFLDAAFPLEGHVKHSEIVDYTLDVETKRLEAVKADGTIVGLAQPQKLAGYRGHAEEVESLLLKNNGLHVELVFNPSAERGKLHKAGLQDIKLESALTTIMDLEDSVAVVDAEDKVEAYRNWLGLMNGNIVAKFFDAKGQVTTRGLESAHRVFLDAEGTEFSLPGRSLNLIRNVGIFMPPNDTLLNDQGKPVEEFFADVVTTALIAMKNLKGDGNKNSKTGSIYVVVPKLHGPKEVAFVNDVFARVEDMLGLERNTMKVGLMDEEERTSVNLKECIRAIKDRVFFVNTGFLDRTGDKIHTDMRAGLLEQKTAMKSTEWFMPYENSNVRVALAAGFSGNAQVGKGMYAEPENMQGLYKTKMAHPLAGASTAWTPSPKAAAIHAMHYHLVNVSDVQSQLLEKLQNNAANDAHKISSVPFAKEQPSREDALKFLDNNIQGLLGYASRWVKLGIGCSSVPDMNGVMLMEDCATVRISAQSVANGMIHGLYSTHDVEDSIKRMSAKVDEQNKKVPNYRPMTENDDDNAVKAVYNLVFYGHKMRNGYVQPDLYRYRLDEKMEFGAAANPDWRDPRLQLG